MSEFHATQNNLSFINTTHLISEDRKLLHTFRSNLNTVAIIIFFFSGYVAASIQSFFACIVKRVCVRYQEV